MSDQRRTWRLVWPIALLALVIGTTFGEVWHRHLGSSTETCPVCHMSHQAIEPPVGGVRIAVLLPTRRGFEPQRYRFPSRPSIQQIPTRAPPA